MESIDAAPGRPIERAVRDGIDGQWYGLPPAVFVFVSACTPAAGVWAIQLTAIRALCFGKTMANTASDRHCISSFSCFAATTELPRRVADRPGADGGCNCRYSYNHGSLLQPIRVPRTCIASSLVSGSSNMRVEMAGTRRIAAVAVHSDGAPAG